MKGKSTANPMLLGIDVQSVNLGTFQQIKHIYVALLKSRDSIKSPHNARNLLNLTDLKKILKELAIAYKTHAAGEEKSVTVGQLLQARNLLKIAMLSDSVRDNDGNHQWFDRLKRTELYIRERNGIWEKIEDAVKEGIERDLDREPNIDINQIIESIHGIDLEAKKKILPHPPIAQFNQIGHRFDEKLLRALRLREGANLYYVRNRNLRLEIDKSYSGSSIAMSGKLSHLFQFDTFAFSGRWCHTSGTMSAIRSTECYQIMHPDEFVNRYPNDTPLPYRDHFERPNRDGYHGILVKFRGDEVVLSGPPVICWWFYDEPEYIQKIENLCRQIGIQPPSLLQPEKTKQTAMTTESQQLSLF